MSTTISRLYNWVTDKANSVKITASKMDGENDQIVTALNRKVLCSGSAPSSPIAGQTWYDTTNKFLKAYRNNEWVIQGIVHVGTTSPTTSQEGDLWYKTSDDLLYKYDGSSWTAVASTFTPSATNALSGSVIQVVNTQTGAVATGTTAIPSDDSIPQNTEGTEFMTRAITPNASANKLKITVTFFGSQSTSGSPTCVALFQDSTADALACGYVSGDNPNTGDVHTTFTHYMEAGTTSSTTFKVRAGNHAGSTITFNGGSSARKYGGVLASSITIEEIKA